MIGLERAPTAPDVLRQRLHDTLASNPRDRLPTLRMTAFRLVPQLGDTDKDQRWAQRLGVQGIPEVHLFADGRHVAGETGARPATFWRQWVAPHVG